MAASSLVDLSYVRCMKVLMAGQGYPMLATHDPRLIDIGIEQAQHRPLHQVDTRAHDIHAYRQGDDRVEPLPAGQRDRADTDDDAGRGPDVGHQVPRVGVQGNGLVDSARLPQAQRNPEIDN